jgi:metal transporter CNNM
MHTASTFIEVFVLVAVSALCSGLNVGLMSLDTADLLRKAKLGNVYARRLYPLRKNVHLSLASILLSNVAVISATSLVLDKEYNGLIAEIASTILIVIFGEVTPQALFMRDALLFCGRLSWLLRGMIIVTYPISKPLQLLLDALFGHQESRLQSRHELGLMIAEHANAPASELDEDEVEIMRGALSLSEKRVRDIMTPLEKVFWMTPHHKIDAQTLDDLKRNGYSRIPIFNQQRTVCFGILLLKDLIDINFDRETPSVHELPLYPCQIVGSMTALDTLFRKFINGNTHLIPVERDDEIVGIVTIEDLLEEIVGHEIEDETDARKRRRRLVTHR